MGIVEQTDLILNIEPAVSVVMPTFNRAHMLRRSIVSVLNQTFSNFELIIVDDGSIDNTSSTIEEFDDPRIIFLPLGKNFGGNYARNQGIKASRADYVAFLDSDDEWLPTKLELQISRLHSVNDDEANIVYCQYYEYQDLTKRKILFPSIYEGDVFDQLLKGWCPVLSTFVIKRSDLLEVQGFDESLPSFQDYDLFLRLAELEKQFVAVSEPLVNKYVHNSHQITGSLNVRLEGFKVFQARWGDPMKNRFGFWGYRRWVTNHLGFVYFRQIQKAIDEKDTIGAWKNFFEVLRFLPFSKGLALKGLVLILAGSNVYQKMSRFKNASSELEN